MDNLTHAVTGLAAGELIHRVLPFETDDAVNRTRHRLLLTAGALAANFPDLDLILTPLLPDPLGYLLHHRGHTHTFLYALPQALLLAALLWLAWPAARRLLAASKPARLGLVLTLAAGFISHIALDYLNSYGVHPFHPFDSRWLYGDMVFIIEPAFWIALGIPLIMSLRHRELKAVLAAVLGGVLLFFTWRGFLAWPSTLALLAAGALLAAVQQRDAVAGVRGLVLGLALLTGFALVQNAASARAGAMARQLAHQHNPGGRVADVALNAFPANPVCWIFLTVETDQANNAYLLRRGIVSLAPDWVPVTACPAGLAERSSQIPVNAGSAVFFVATAKLDALRGLQRSNCHFDAWLRFARAPLLEDGRANDLRFATSLRGNFTTMRLADFENRECSRYIPQWDRPRADILK